MNSLKKKRKKLETLPWTPLRRGPPAVLSPSGWARAEGEPSCPRCRSPVASRSCPTPRKPPQQETYAVQLLKEPEFPFICKITPSSRPRVVDDAPVLAHKRFIALSSLSKDSCTSYWDFHKWSHKSNGSVIRYLHHGRKANL